MPQATITDHPNWADNEVLLIPADAPVEGAKEGGSYGGLGIDNYPHQQLANRTAFLLQLVGQVASATVGEAAESGWVAIPFMEGGTTRRNLLVQWGTSQVTIPPNRRANHAVSWPRQFLSLLCVVAVPILYSTLQDPNEFLVQYSPGASSTVIGEFGCRSTTSARHDFSWLAIGLV